MNVPISDEISGCLVEHPSCQYAVKLGFSYLCEHPESTDFRENNSSHPIPTQKELLEQYAYLRLKRRNEYKDAYGKLLEDMHIRL